MQISCLMIAAQLFPRPHIDLFEGLSTHNLSDAIPGVNLAVGPHSTGTAINFEGEYTSFYKIRI